MLKIIEKLLPQTKGKKMPSRPNWGEDTKKWVISKVHEDSRTFLNYANKPLDFWQL